MSAEYLGLDVIQTPYNIAEIFDARIIEGFDTSPHNTGHWIPCFELKLNCNVSIWICSRKPLNRDKSIEWFDGIFYRPDREWNYVPLVKLLPARFYHRFFTHRELIGIEIAFM